MRGGFRLPGARAPLVPPVLVLTLLLLLPAGALPGAAGRPAAPALAPVPGSSHDLNPTSSVVGGLAGVPMVWSVPLPYGEVTASSRWNFGDGSTGGGTALVLTHTYTNPGWYALTVNITDTGGTSQDDLQGIPYLQVEPSFVADATRPGAALTVGDFAELSGRFLSNTTSGAGATGVLRPGDAVTVAVSVAHPPTAAGSSLGTPAFTVGSPLSIAARFGADGSGNATVTVPVGAAPGVYLLNYSVPTDVGSSVFPNVYTFTLVVGPGDASRGYTVPASPSPSTLRIDLAGGPGATFDPAFDYDTAGLAALANTYEQLITYNGSLAGPSASDYNPDLAACVPGSALCQALFGTSLVSGNNYTFVLDPHARFYDPSTKAVWPVYPSDVLFSFARDLAFADVAPGGTPGWILAQALLPGPNSPQGAANPLYDGGQHAPYNNTPQQIFSAIGVNTSACPPIALTNYHGCVTLEAGGNGESWPFLLGLLADPQGGSVLSCGWASSPATTGGQAGIPNWTAGTPGDEADQPCTLPGGATSSTSPAFESAVAAIAPTAWDAWALQSAGRLFGYPPVGQLTNLMVGSGPYAVLTSSAAASQFVANPAYAPNPSCTWTTCAPRPSFGRVNLTYDVAPGAGLAAVATGTADLTDVVGGESGAVTTAVQDGSVYVRSIPSSILEYDPFNFALNVTGAENLTGRSFTAPSSLFADPNVRQFLITAFPTATVQTREGEQVAYQTQFLGGGQVPELIGSGAPANVSWPVTDPSPNAGTVGTAAWWWTQVQQDHQAGNNCTASVPCTFPLVYNGSALTPRYTEWAQNISLLSGNALQAVPVDLPSADAYSFLFSVPGTNPLPVYQGGWVADYPDLSDYVRATWSVDSTYTFPDSVAESSPDGSGCSASASYWSQLTTPVPYACEGAAFQALQGLVGGASNAPLGAGRTVDYAMADRIVSELGLYAANYQLDTSNAVAAWIDPSTLNSNPMLGGFDAQLWAGIRILGAASQSGPTPSAALQASAAATDVGVPVVLWTNLSSAHGLSYTYSGLPGCSVPDQSQVECVPTHAGQFSVNVSVAISGAASPLTATVLLVVNPDPRIQSFTADPALFELGNGTTLSVAVSGGTAPFTYLYSGLPPGCTSANTVPLTCTPTGPGTFSVQVEARDHVGRWDNATVSFQVGSSSPGGGSPTGGLFGLPGNLGLEILAFALVVVGIGVVAVVLVLRRGRGPPAAPAEEEYAPADPGPEPAAGEPSGEPEATHPDPPETEPGGGAS